LIIIQLSTIIAVVNINRIDITSTFEAKNPAQRKLLY